MTRQTWATLGQEVLSEAIEYGWRLYQVHHGQLSWKDFTEQTLRSFINALMTGVFAFAIQALLLTISAGAAGPLATLTARLLGSVLGPVVGNCLMTLFTEKIVNGNH